MTGEPGGSGEGPCSVINRNSIQVRSLRKAAILDRDGVLNDNRRPVNRPEELHLFADAARAVRMLNEAGLLVLVATNQGGVGLGYLSAPQLARIHAAMVAQLAAAGARIDGIAACIHRPDAGCSCRKPRPGLLLQLRDQFHLDLRASYMVGDRAVDIEAGRAAGTKTVGIGREAGPLADYAAISLWDAARWICADAAKSDGRQTPMLTSAHTVTQERMTER
ncbi:MAG: HAD family hydrolase [Alicyclobacillus sp.]|nr:HAD family hydrolase [Alicyclobacillus sp.]